MRTLAVRGALIAAVLLAATSTAADGARAAPVAEQGPTVTAAPDATPAVQPVVVLASVAPAGAIRAAPRATTQPATLLALQQVTSPTGDTNVGTPLTDADLERDDGWPLWVKVLLGVAILAALFFGVRYLAREKPDDGTGLHDRSRR